MKQITRLKLLCSTLKITALLAAIAASLFFENVNAQFDGGVADSRNIKVIGKGPGIEPGNVIPLQTNSTVTVECPAGNGAEITASRKIVNIVRFVFYEETQKYIPSDFTATIKVKIEYGHSSSPTYHSTEDHEFTVSYKKDGGTKYDAKNYLSFEGAEYVKITVTEGITVTPAVPEGIDMTDLLYLEDEMKVTRYYQLQPGITLPAFPEDIVSNTPPVDSYIASWSVWPAASGANATQLEWTWLEDDMAPNFYTPGTTTVDIDKLFAGNATRVDLSLDRINYSIPLFYDGEGTLYYRVRPVNINNNGSRADGPWSAPGKVYYEGHNNDMNWQVRTSFAEEGKMKSVMEYFDGSLRSRQTVTKENVNNTTVTAETFYDYEGRPAIQILPAPSMNNVIAYTKKLNQFNLQSEAQNPAEFFDLDATIPGMSKTNGSSKYYSDANDDISTGPNANIPDAEEYPFTATRYTPDGTGRVRAQSGVGPAFKLGSDRETKYYYGTPAQEELDGLFGYEVGYKSHYFKNMVKDANGQMSVSYVDMHGRTIATALAGKPGVNSPLVPINNDDNIQYPGQQTDQAITRNLLDQHTNIIKNNAIESVNSLLVPSRTEYHFSYQLSPESLSQQTCTNTPVCYDCLYDLEISVTDESGDVDQPYVWKYKNISVQGDVDETCNTGNDFATVSCPGGEPCNAVVNNTVTIDKWLDPGSYSIRKTLTISESSLQKYKALFLQPGKGICQTEEEIAQTVYEELQAASNCNTTPETTDCQQCEDELGLYPAYRTNYLVSIDQPDENVPQALETEIQRSYNAGLEKCKSMCAAENNVSPLMLSKRQLMLADMMPYGGQYARNPNPEPDEEGGPPTPLVPGTSPTLFNTYNIFLATSNGTPHYRRPRTQALTYAADTYKDNYGNTDQQIQPGGSMTVLDAVDMDPKKFTGLFVDSWADALLAYHPEYPRLKFAEDNLAASYNWIYQFNSVNTYNDAVSGGYLVTSGTTTPDPFYSVVNAAALKPQMNTWITSDYDGKQHGLWELARIQVKCKNIPNDALRQACYEQNETPTPVRVPPFLDVTTDAEKNEMWLAFRGLYTSARERQVNQFIVTQKPLADADELVNEGYQLRFGTDKQIADQSGFINTFPSAIGDAPTNINPYIGVLPTDPLITGNQQSQCDSYIDYWKNKLLQCEALRNHPQKNTILEEITAGMVAVCKKGIDEANPYGSSTVNPATPVDGSPRSFEEVITNVYTTYEIDTRNDYFCNPYVIDYPKPWGKGPKYADETTTLVTQCACDNFSAMKAEAFTAGYDTAQLSSMNEWLQSKNLEILTDEMFQALRHCSSYHHEVCYTPSQALTYSCNDPEPPTCSNSNTRTSYPDKTACPGPVNADDWTGVIATFFDENAASAPPLVNYAPDCQDKFTAFFNNYFFFVGHDSYCTTPWTWAQIASAYHTVTGQTLNVCQACSTTVTCEGTQVCSDEFLPHILSTPQPLPDYLKCGGWPAQSKCLSCAGMNDLTTEFKEKFDAPYNSGPIFTGTDLTPAQVQQNILYSNFINFRTGLQLGWMQYAQATAGTTCAEGGEGGGSVVDLTVDHRSGNTPAQYVASNSITFVTGFESGDNDEFETLLAPNEGGNELTIVCRPAKPVNDGTDIWVTEGPCEHVHTLAMAIAHKRYMDMLQAQEAAFEAQYREKCLAAKDLEDFTVSYTNTEFHYTLYYYDMAGSLVKTVPPKGVKPDFSKTYTDQVALDRKNGTYNTVLPPHELVTQYRYNSLGGVIAQHSPDANTSHFWYDRLGRLVVSQNAKQVTENKYSYTVYDLLGRITEVGEKVQTTAISQTISQDDEVLADWIVNNGARSQITYTGYDEPFGATTGSPEGVFSGNGLEQHNMRNRVSYTGTRNSPIDGNVPPFLTATFYTYDVHGNVETLMQDYRGLDLPGLNALKRIEYNYDLVSGKVNMVSYQPDFYSAGLEEMVVNADKFFHKYEYDAENRLTAVYTSRDKIEWERDAAYNYYKHGPLSRTVLGQLQVQGLDYAYTLQGWMKGVNGTTVGDGSYDMGKDGLVTGGDAPPVARDIFGFSLHYYDDGDDEMDYKIISTSGSTGMFARPNNGAFKSLYNGNIAGMSVNNAGLQKADPASTNAMPLFYNYRYDQLNRIVSMQAYQGLTGTNTWTPTAMNDYSEAISYDPNGNIMSYNRNGINPAKTPPSGYAGGYDMDKLRYKYYYYDASDNKLPYNPVTGVPAGGRATNQLAWVDDEVTNDNAYPDDINKQNYTDNYQYDEIGNLVKDKTEGITNINWTVYGKIASIQKGESTISYTYDASGNRVTKTANNKTTVYVRDPSGNVMSVYEREGVGAMLQTETHLYGITRIGIATQLTKPVTTEDLQGGFGKANISIFTRGEKLFELSNHLGNVLATVTDRKLQQTADNTAVAYYVSDVVSAQDYYPFGSLMPGRKFSSGNYRYGFNGKENDNEVKGIEGSQQDYGMRIYDPRVGRFLSVDPIAYEFPWNSTYAFAEGDPVNYNDLDGLEKPETPASQTTNSTKPKVEIKVDNDLLNGRSGGSVEKGFKTVEIPKPPRRLPPLSKPGFILRLISDLFTSSNDSYTDKVMYKGAKEKGFSDPELNQKWADEHNRMNYPDDVIERDKEKEDIVYRGGAFSTTNFTPRPGKDDGEEKDKKSGLSTFRTPLQATQGQEGKAQKIDLNVLRKMGFVITEVDGHVGIRPPTQEELKQWAKTRGETIHYRTVMVMAARTGEVRVKNDK